MNHSKLIFASYLEWQSAIFATDSVIKGAQNTRKIGDDFIATMSLR
jgi:hypothetical protein